MASTVRRDLKKIAREVLDLTARKTPWRPVTADIASTFGLSHKQAQRVVRHGRHIAAKERGQVWGYYDRKGVGGYLGYGASEEKAGRILGYYSNKLDEDMESLQHNIDGALASGLIGQEVRNGANGLLYDARRLVDSAQEELNREVPDPEPPARRRVEDDTERRGDAYARVWTKMHSHR